MNKKNAAIAIAIAVALAFVSLAFLASYYYQGPKNAVRSNIYSQLEEMSHLINGDGIPKDGYVLISMIPESEKKKIKPQYIETISGRIIDLSRKPFEYHTINGGVRLGPRR